MSTLLIFEKIYPKNLCQLNVKNVKIKNINMSKLKLTM